METGSTEQDVGYDVAVSSAGDGSVYITGQTNASLHGQPHAGLGDIFLLKYNSTSGALLWTRQSGSASDDCGYGVAVSPSGGHVYVTGYASGSLGGLPYTGAAGDTTISTIVCEFNRLS